MSLDTIFVTTEEEKELIKKHYDRSDEEVEEDIKHLKDWLKKQPHLPQDEDEIRLRSMLYYNKFSLEKTKNKLDTYYSIKHILPEYYADRSPLNPNIVKQLNSLVLMPLPRLTPELERVIFIKFTDPDPANFTFLYYIRTVFAMLDLRIEGDLCMGDHYVVDAEHAKLGHFVQFTPVNIKNIYSLLEKAYSDRIKGIHFVNLPAYGNATVAIINAIMSEKIAGRVHVHKQAKNLNKSLPKYVLPNEYGGTAGPMNDIYANWRKYYESRSDYIVELGEKRSDESKRIGNPISSELFGVCGSFRKLAVD